MRTLLWLGVSIFSLCYKEILAQYAGGDAYSGQPNHQFRHSHSSPSHLQLNNYHRYSAHQYILPTKSKTEYGVHTEQSKTAEIQKGKLTTHSNLPTQYYFVTTNTTIFNVPKKSEQRAYRNKTITRPQHQFKITQHPCIKCPSEKIIIARKGLDGVLIEPPKLASCQNRDITNEMYQIQTLFGPSFKFLLPHGTHSIHAKIFNKLTGKHVLSCTLRYQVIVQRCEHFIPRDQNIKMDCDIGNIWGSHCHFRCRTGYLSHTRPIVCGDSLKWEGNEPECTGYPPLFNKVGHLPREETSCSFLKVPDNGKFSCVYPNGINSKNYEYELKTPDGTICRVICDNYYEIPNYLEPFSIFHCKSGHWNVTTQNFCRPKKYDTISK